MNLPAAKILIVDDDRSMTVALSLRLQARGFVVRVFDSALLAADVVLRERPNLILLDIDMPHFTGFEFHECLRLTERGRQIPVVYVTGRQNESMRMAAMKLGATGFICKPYESTELIETLERALAMRSGELFR